MFSIERCATKEADDKDKFIKIAKYQRVDLLESIVQTDPFYKFCKNIS